jgi:hypothetical protein
MLIADMLLEFLAVNGEELINQGVLVQESEDEEHENDTDE